MTDVGLTSATILWIGDARAGHRSARRDERGLALEEVLDGLDEDDVDAAFEEPLHLGDVRVTEVGEGDVQIGRALWPPGARRWLREPEHLRTAAVAPVAKRVQRIEPEHVGGAGARRNDLVHREDPRRLPTARIRHDRVLRSRRHELHRL